MNSSKVRKHQEVAPALSQNEGFQVKIVKKEEEEAEDYFGGTLTPVEQKNEEFQNIIIKKEAEEDDYLYGGTSSPLVQQNGEIQKTVKKEEAEDFQYGGTSTPVIQQNGEIQKAVKKEEAQDENFHYGGTSTPVDQQNGEIQKTVKKEEAEDESSICKTDHLTQTPSSSHTITVLPPGPVLPPSRSGTCERTRNLTEAVLENQDKIYEAVLSINDSLTDINTTLRELCNAIKSSQSNKNV